MIGRHILPWFGGGPAVWTNCLLFFQVVLLAGYGYAHWLGSRSTTRPWIWVHIGLLAASLLFLPMAPQAGIWKPVGSGDPSGRILLLLAATAGGPYFLLSATSPLLQRWYGLSRPGESPYRLYALANLGSFLALLSYPFAVEPFLRLRTQAWIWSVLYAGFAALAGWTAWRLTPAAPAAASLYPGAEAARLPAGPLVLWVLSLPSLPQPARAKAAARARQHNCLRLRTPESHMTNLLAGPPNPGRRQGGDYSGATGGTASCGDSRKDLPPSCRRIECRGRMPQALRKRP